MKEFDVHFKISLSDFFSAIEAESKKEAKEIAKEWLSAADDITREKIVISLIQDMQCGFLEFEITDVLDSEEVEKL